MNETRFIIRSMTLKLPFILSTSEMRVSSNVGPIILDLQSDDE